MKKLIGVMAMMALTMLSTNLLFGQDAALKNDPDVTTGKLKNGFQYFIKHNQEPKGRATIFLANKVGSILETDQEQGIAHFIEHMNFNGTKHFPKNELISYLERSGVKFGADLNAFTSFDETVYQLPLPTDDATLWQKGLLIMRDWAADATLSETDFQQERGVIREEKRLRNTASGRVGELYRPLLYNYSRYANRMPIGKDKVIDSASVDVARTFYKKWYRPDLQALIIVGDIDVVKVEKQITALFSDLKLSPKPVVRPRYPIALRDSSSFLKVTDPELEQYVIQYYYKAVATPLRTEHDFELQLVRQLTNALYANRLRELMSNSKMPYLGARAQVGGLVGNLDALTLSVSLNPELIKPGFQAFWLEMERIKRFGFTAEEVQAAKSRLSRAMELAVSEKNKTKSADYADDYLQYFTKGDAYLSVAERDQLVKRFIGQITQADLKTYLSKFLNSADRTIIVLGPEKSKGNLPDKSRIAEWETAAVAQPIIAFKSEATGQTLLVKQPEPGKILKEEKIEKLGLLHWQLSNGMNVYVKPTVFKNDEVLFTGFSKGGTSLYNLADFYSAKSAAAIIASSGLGRFTSNQFNGFLNTKALQVKPYIEDRSEGISGASSTKDLRIALEVVHAYMSEPRLDTARFSLIMQQSKAAFRNRTSNPDRDFSDTITKVLGGNHPRRQPTTIADLDKIDSAKVHAIFRERFKDASNFNFVFTGNVQTDSLRLWVEHYLASLPGNGTKEVARDLNIRVPEGRIRKDLMEGKGDKASVQLVLSGKYDFNSKNNLYLDLLKSALNFRLTERLREKEGGVYSPAVYVTKAKEPIGFYALMITFDCDPGKMDKLIKATQEEIFLLAKNGVSQDDLNKFKAEQSREDELALRSNDFWLGYLQEQLENNEPLSTVLNNGTLIKLLGSKESVGYSQRFLNEHNEIIFTLRPKIN
ncbi:hypothetical protein A0256_14190 [Mucilaginibacter sp. PAMC 26640]|nr:hypothetical protein A0256_14190 [Mucilaginibacter sp. PAMC 26640]